MILFSKALRALGAGIRLVVQDNDGTWWLSDGCALFHAKPPTERQREAALARAAKHTRPRSYSVQTVRNTLLIYAVADDPVVEVGEPRDIGPLTVMDLRSSVLSVSIQTKYHDALPDDAGWLLSTDKQPAVAIVDGEIAAVVMPIQVEGEGGVRCTPRPNCSATSTRSCAGAWSGGCGAASSARPPGGRSGRCDGSGS